ncbi:MAG: hypothetical protein R3C26_03830 [Calditrichia bacterium]
MNIHKIRVTDTAPTKWLAMLPALAMPGKFWMLIHHDPNHCDEDLMNIQNQAQQLFSNAFVAVEESVFLL